MALMGDKLSTRSLVELEPGSRVGCYRASGPGSSVSLLVGLRPVPNVAGLGSRCSRKGVGHRLVGQLTEGSKVSQTWRQLADRGPVAQGDLRAGFLHSGESRVPRVSD